MDNELIWIFDIITEFDKKDMKRIFKIKDTFRFTHDAHYPVILIIH